ncbi:MAG TPA: tetratricopeptide repeat protein, partial [Candidatus Angelobacter sp.]|nr:tetratricopeptide repeat protein [Candidatus Angelobacter sp.]
MKLFKAANLPRDAAEDELQAGDIYFSLGQYENALHAYRQVLSLAPDDSELRCRVFSHMARTYATRGQSAPAAKYSEEALSLSAGLSGATQAEAFLVRGEALQNRDPVKAAELFQRAQEHFAQVGDKNGQARALLLLAYIRFRSQRADASRLAGQALQLWSEIDDLDGVAQARFALGLFAAVTGEFETAQCNYQRALPVFHIAGDKDNEAITLNGLGYVARERGDPETSLGSYQNAKTIFAAVNDQLGAVEAISGIGKTLSVLERKRELLALFREKLRLAREIKIPALEASALADMASVYEIEHRYAKAQALYEKALALYKSEQREYGEGDVLMALARMQVEQGHDSQALPLLKTARPLKDKTGQIEDLARIDYAMADIYRRLNRLDEARAAIEKTIAVIETQRLKIASFDSRA